MLLILHAYITMFFLLCQNIIAKREDKSIGKNYAESMGV